MIHQIETNEKFAEIIGGKVKYLTVDEYQDTNPVQEKLIRILKGFGANICVVGDDDQTIYQLRGSNTKNILTIKERYNIQKYLFLDTDYRSTEGIVDVARRVILYNDNRLAKTLQSGCLVKYDLGDIAYAECKESEEEFDFIANRIVKLHSVGVPYSEMAVLLRKRKISSMIAEKLEEYHIPFVVEGVNDLFGTKESQEAKGIYENLDGELSFTDLFKMWLDIEYPLDKKELADALQYLATIDVKEIKLYSDLNLQPLVSALGYGNVMHEIVKNIHKVAIAGEVIERKDVKRMIDESFYLPYATQKLAENMYKSVTKAINQYVEQNRQEFDNI